MNPFEKHGIDHLSYSQANLFSQQPLAWVVRYLYNIKDDGSPATWRGRAVEKGLDTYLFSGDIGRGLMHAVQEYDHLSQGLADEKAAQERDNVPEIYKQAVSALNNRGTPLFRQRRYEIKLPGLAVPVVAFTDYEWEDYGLDLKTTLRMPSNPSASHITQMALYSYATDKPFSLLYCTPKKNSIYPVTEGMALPAFKRLHRTLLSMQKVLEMCDTKEQAAHIFGADFESYLWTPDMMKKLDEVYGDAG
jgi:hypothetical protein